MAKNTYDYNVFFYQHKMLCRAKTIGAENETVEGYYLPVDNGAILIAMEKPNDNTNKELSLSYHEIDPNSIRLCTGKYDDTKWSELSDKEQTAFLSKWNWKEHRLNRPEEWQGILMFEGDKISVVFDYGDDTQTLDTVITYQKPRAGFTPYLDEYWCDACDAQCEIKSIHVKRSM